MHIFDVPNSFMKTLLMTKSSRNLETVQDIR